jgi:hypothetical protein
MTVFSVYMARKTGAGLRLALLSACTPGGGCIRKIQPLAIPSARSFERASKYWNPHHLVNRHLRTHRLRKHRLRKHRLRKQPSRRHPVHAPDPKAESPQGWLRRNTCIWLCPGCHTVRSGSGRKKRGSRGGLGTGLTAP